MEHSFGMMPTCLGLSSCDASRVAVGFVDGSIQVAGVDVGEKKFEVSWSAQQKRAIRAVFFDEDDASLFSLAANRALISYDVESGKRTRVIRESHKDKPLAACTLSTSATKGQQFATGDEGGQIRTWDWRVKDPIVCEWDEQKEAINALTMDRQLLLAASSDGTLGAYDLRKRKLLLCSELMHSELVSICVALKYTYVGGSDGHIEVFKRGEYGNILERIESGHEKGVNSVVELRRGLLMTATEEDEKIRLLNVEPNHRLGVAATHGDGGVDRLVLTADREWIVSLACFDQSLKWHSVKQILDAVPLMRSEDFSKKKKKEKEKKEKKNGREGFFDGLLEKAEKSDDDDDESEVDEDEEEEGSEKENVGEEEEGEGEGEEEEESAEDEGEREEREDDDDEEVEDSGEDEEEEEQLPPEGKRRRLK